MDYLYSTVVDPSTYETDGLAEGIPLRVHAYPELEEKGIFRAQEDWRELVGPVNNYRGCLGPSYSIMAIAFPECLPDRLEIISYACEFIFLHDDIIEIAEKENADVKNDEMMDAFKQGAQLGFIESKGSGKRQLQSKILLDMMKLDRERAITSAKMWARYAELAAGRQHHIQFTSLDEYIPYRILDVGEMFWFAVVTFGMGISIPEEEMNLCRSLMRSAWIAVGLTNDYYSWEKEYKASLENGQTHVVNAIWVLMREHSLTVDQAKDLCGQKIKANVAEYLRIVEENRNNENISLDLRRYIESMQYTLSGNVVWSKLCPRYHPAASYNESQLLRMKHGLKEYPIQSYKEVKASQITTERNSAIKAKPLSNGVHSQTNGINGVDVGRRDINGFGQVNGHAHPSKVNKTVDVLKHECIPMFNEKTESIALGLDLPRLGGEVVLAPFQYLISLPSKGVREKAIDAFNFWVKAPSGPLEIIKSAVTLLHSASLMLDDIEDNSPLRRGKPSTHTIFGTAQTINSSNYIILEALKDVSKLGGSSPSIFIDELNSLYVGQSFDLYWTYNLHCPSIKEYLKMVDQKTGGLFRLIAKLLTAQSNRTVDRDLCDLSTLLGRYFQIRDDYQNLTSTEYTKQKGYCEDLDEGKYSLPLIHALQMEPNNMQLRGVLVQRRWAGTSTLEHKRFVLETLKRTKSLEYTASILKTLHGEIEQEMERVEMAWGAKNFSLRLLLEMLQV